MTAGMNGNWSCGGCGSGGTNLSGTVSLDFGGTVTPVPLPGAIWLFGSGLALIGARCRRRPAAG